MQATPPTFLSAAHHSRSGPLRIFIVPQQAAPCTCTCRYAFPPSFCLVLTWGQNPHAASPPGLPQRQQLCGESPLSGSRQGSQAVPRSHDALMRSPWSALAGRQPPGWLRRRGGSWPPPATAHRSHVVAQPVSFPLLGVLHAVVATNVSLCSHWQSQGGRRTWQHSLPQVSASPLDLAGACPQRCLQPLAASPQTCRLVCTTRQGCVPPPQPSPKPSLLSGDHVPCKLARCLPSQGLCLAAPASVHLRIRLMMTP